MKGVPGLMTSQVTRQTQNIWITLYNVGPTSKTLGRRCTNVIQMFCVCWAGQVCDTQDPL